MVRGDVEWTQRICDRPQPQHRRAAAGRSLWTATPLRRRLWAAARLLRGLRAATRLLRGLRAATRLRRRLWTRAGRCLRSAGLLCATCRSLRTGLLRTARLLWSGLGLAKAVGVVRTGSEWTPVISTFVGACARAGFSGCAN